MIEAAAENDPAQVLLNISSGAISPYPATERKRKTGNGIRFILLRKLIYPN
jgi:hypothetical protein